MCPFQKFKFDDFKYIPKSTFYTHFFNTPHHHIFTRVRRADFGMYL